MGRNGSKYFSDHLSPLYRFLDKQVGRRWDDVWSEISAVVPAKSTMQLHARNHVFDWIQVRCRRGEDGKVYGQTRYGKLVPIEDGCGRARLYVVPETGLIARIPSVKRRRRSWISKEEQLARWRSGAEPYCLGVGLDLLNVRGTWFYVAFEDRWTDGAKVRVALEKRQLSKKEIRDVVPAKLK